MITVTRLNGKPIVINAILIETIEETPDTMITLINGKKIIVLEKSSAVAESIRLYMQSIGVLHATVKSLDSEGL
jgi:flagellar protein FlbD